MTTLLISALPLPLSFFYSIRFSIQFYPILSSWFCLLYNVLRASPTLDDLGKPRNLRLRHCTLFPLPTIYESGKERVVARDCAIRHEFLLLQSLRIHGWLYPVKFYHSNLSIKSLEPFHFVPTLFFFLVHRPCLMCRHTFIGNHTTTYHHTPLATGLDMSRKRYTHLLFFFFGFDFAGVLLHRQSTPFIPDIPCRCLVIVIF